MNTNGHDAEEALDKKASQKVKEIISDVRDKSKTMLNEGWETAKEHIDEKKKSFEKKAGELREKTVTEILDDVKVSVRKSPLQSIALAAGIGWILGWLFKSDD